jgi:hypothetical protein
MTHSFLKLTGDIGADQGRVTEECSGNNKELDTGDTINPLHDGPESTRHTFIALQRKCRVVEDL